jgi:propionyl-CoA carboxylase alpha chain
MSLKVRVVTGSSACERRGPTVRRLLVANRGEIARRVIRAARSLGIETVAVYAKSDAEALFVEEADLAIALSGTTARQSYLDVAQLLAAAARAGCDAVHPGYGFLSENAVFAEAVRQEGMVFVGPSSKAIAALGDKLSAARQMAAAGVPVLESHEVTKGSPTTGEVSFPAMLKSAAGGGGKGMRVVEGPHDLEDAVAAARREAAASFGDDRVFLEPYLGRARHVEVQIFGDSHGNLVQLFERECSIQRRHQKVLEEAPSPAVSDELREALGEAALSAARAVGYENAGTVEFLLDDDGSFYFLEVNTRIQVEHPVTEQVTGRDLVREQLLVAAGEPLSFSQGDLALNGHAIEARLYAEDPENDFLPATGRLSCWRESALENVRYESGVREGDVVGTEFDPLLAKVIAWGPTRPEAARLLASSLRETAVGGITTNRRLLVSVLEHPEFQAGETTTSFLSEHAARLSQKVSDDDVMLAAAFCALSEEDTARRSAPVLTSLPSGFRVGRLPREKRSFAGPNGEASVEYQRHRDGSYLLEVATGTAAAAWSVRRRRAAPGQIALEIDGLREAATLFRDGARTLVLLRGGEQVELAESDRFPEKKKSLRPGEMVAPMPGSVLSVAVSEGDEVEAGQLLVVVEAMKMEHRVSAAVSGRVSAVLVAPGAQVQSGDLLVSLESNEQPVAR